MDEIAIVSAAANSATAITALVALLFASRQIALNKAIHLAETRPYVVPELKFGINRQGNESVYLVVTNHGHTPALNVHLRFMTDEPWHMLQNPSFPFTPSEPGIPVIAPSQSISYFLGRKTSTAKFLRTFDSSIGVSVSCGNLLNSKSETFEYILTLRNDYKSSQSND